MRKRYVIEKDRRITRRSERNLQTGEKETLCRKNEKIRKEIARSR